MPTSLWDAQARQRLLHRLERLEPDATALWGRMNAPQMLAHLADWMQMAKGELKCEARRLPLRYSPLRELAIFWLPFPRGIRTAPELISREPLEWAVERAAVRQHVQSFEKLDPNTLWREHPVFGKMTPKAWGVLGYRHADHHFNQFGV